MAHDIDGITKHLAATTDPVMALLGAQVVATRASQPFEQTVREAARDYDLPPPELKRECPWIWAEMVASYYNEAKGELLEALDKNIEVTGPAIVAAIHDCDEGEIGRIFSKAIYAYIEQYVWRKYEEARAYWATEQASRPREFDDRDEAYEKWLHPKTSKDFDLNPATNPHASGDWD